MEYFTLPNLKQLMSIKDALNFYARLKRKGLGDYKMSKYSNSRCESIIQSMLHFDIKECLQSDLCKKDKEFLQSLLEIKKD